MSESIPLIILGIILYIGYFIFANENEKERRAIEEKRWQAEEARKAKEEAEKQARIKAMSPEARKAYEFEKWLGTGWTACEVLPFFRRAGMTIETKDYAKRNGITISKADDILSQYGSYTEHQTQVLTSTGRYKTTTVGAYKIMSKEEFYKRYNFKYPA